MNSLDDVFVHCKANNRAALVGYLPAGYPDKTTSLAAVGALAEAGADIIEVGVPYTDPLMDGPVIQAAAQEALANGFRFADLFDCVAAAKAAGAVPVVMSYWNPVLRYGVERFAADLAAAGGAGLITPDLIPDEAGEWIASARSHDLASIFLVAPSSTDARLKMTAQASSGFIYVASTMGVTGARASVGGGALGLVERTRSMSHIPLCVGLGVSTGPQANEIAAYADGVIVGSALVAALRDDSSLGRLRSLTAELAQGVRRR